MLDIWVELPSGNQCSKKIYLIPDVQPKSGLGIKTYGVVHHWVDTGNNVGYLITGSVALWQRAPNNLWGVVVMFDSQGEWGKKYLTDEFPVDRPSTVGITIPIP
jgi:hypothetical protein